MAIKGQSAFLSSAERHSISIKTRVSTIINKGSKLRFDRIFDKMDIIFFLFLLTFYDKFQTPKKQL